MKRLMGCVLGAGLAVLTMACGSAPPAGPAPADMMAAADALDQQLIDALGKRDLDGVMALYWNSPEVVSFGPDGFSAQGWEATKAALSQTVKGAPASRVEFLEMHNDVRGDVVLGWGRWRMTVPVKEAPPQVVEGRYTDVKAQRDGKWVYIMYHSSPATTPIPTPAPAPARK